MARRQKGREKKGREAKWLGGKSVWNQNGRKVGDLVVIVPGAQKSGRKNCSKLKFRSPPE